MSYGHSEEAWRFAAFENINLETGESYSFSHPDILSAENVGLYNLDVTISNVNGTGDDEIKQPLFSDIVVIEYGNINVDKFPREYIYFNPQQSKKILHLCLFVMDIRGQQKVL